MSKKRSTLSTKNMAITAKSKSLLCSTPDSSRHPASPSCDSDSMCDSEAASPVPFLCTQDGAYGDTDVVWNYYTPRAESAAMVRAQHATPVSSKSKVITKPKMIERAPTRKRSNRDTHKKTQLFQDLLELNQNLQEFLDKKPCGKETSKEISNERSGSDDDIFNDLGDDFTKAVPKSNSRCLRKNLLSSKFNKPETETALESDDSMNECLLKASQMVEENVFNCLPTPAKRSCRNRDLKTPKTDSSTLNQFDIDQDSIDAFLNNIKFESPINNRKADSPRLNNDSFDSFVGNLNDSALERLTQMPIKNSSPLCSNADSCRPNNFVYKKSNGSSMLTSKVSSSSGWTIKELVVHDAGPSPKSTFGRHNSMPESPSVCARVRPSTSGTALNRHNSMPHKNDNQEPGSHDGDSPPMRCTPEEIRRKHVQAKEKLQAKRLFTQSTQLSPEAAVPDKPPPAEPISKKSSFQYKVPSKMKILSEPKPSQPVVPGPVRPHPDVSGYPQSSEAGKIKSIIEKKRMEALLKLKRKRSQNNIP